MDKKTVLIADDDATIRTVLNQALMRAGFNVRVTSNVSTLLQWVKDGQGDVVVSDVNMPDGNAFETLPKIQAARPDLPVIVISAQNTFMTAIKAQEVGAYEYLPKPFDLDDLVQASHRAVSEFKNKNLNERFQEYTQDMPLIGRSPAMQEIYRSIARLTNSDLPVFLSGPNGTGKSLTAKVLHDFGTHKDGAFISANLASMPNEMIEQELFGYEDIGDKSTIGLIAKANNGTLYLKGIENLPLNAQSRLLRVLENGELVSVNGSIPSKVSVRIISSTTQTMDAQLSAKTFRDDLYYRLNVVPLHIPALISRNEDIPDLARHFIKMSEMEGKVSKHLSNDAVASLKAHGWPGNIRELENTIKRICVLYPQETITASVINDELKNNAYSTIQTQTGSTAQFTDLRSATEHYIQNYFSENGDELPPEGVYQKFLDEFEHPIISAALTATNGNQIKAAKVLGLNRNTLRKKINAHNIRIIRVAK